LLAALKSSPVDELVHGVWISISGDVEGLWKTCGLTRNLSTYRLLTPTSSLVGTVDDNRIGVSLRVAISGVLYCGQIWRRLTLGEIRYAAEPAKSSLAVAAIDTTESRTGPKAAVALPRGAP
jgi:hypothetical protein